MYTYTNNDYLVHYGIKGQKWGVRRYQNADGTLTNAGKKRQARIEKSDNRYKEKQAAKVEKYYDKNRRYGVMGTKKVEGINSLQKKLDSQSGKYDKAVIKGQLEAKKALKQMELQKLSSLTHDEIKKEKAAVGKEIVKDTLKSIGMSAVLAPTTGFYYIQTTDAQRVRSNMRLNT